MSATDTQLWSLVLLPLLIFTARVIDVSLGTVRIIFVSRGLRGLAPLIGFFEILVWLAAIGQIVQNIDRPSLYVAYAGGFAAGTWLGLLIEEKLALGMIAVRVVTRTDASDLLQYLGEHDFGVTSFAARGVKGQARYLLTVIRRRDYRRLLRVIEELRPDAFVSISDVRLARRGHFPRSPSTYRSRLRQLRMK